MQQDSVHIFLESLYTQLLHCTLLFESIWTVKRKLAIWHSICYSKRTYIIIRNCRGWRCRGNPLIYYSTRRHSLWSCHCVSFTYYIHRWLDPLQLIRNFLLYLNPSENLCISGDTKKEKQTTSFIQRNFVVWANLQALLNLNKRVSCVYQSWESLRN